MTDELDWTADEGVEPPPTDAELVDDKEPEDLEPEDEEEDD